MSKFLTDLTAGSALSDADFLYAVQGGNARKVTAAQVRTLVLADILASADITLYVATSGSDSTGNGTSGNPYATPQKAVDAAALLTGRKSVVIEIAAGTYATSSRSAGSMDRPALVYIDGMKIGKRTAQSGSTLSGGLVLKLAAGAKITPNTTYPRGIYVTGHVGSVGIVGGEIEAAAGGTEALLTAHRGVYVHCRDLTLDGNSIASVGVFSESGGKAELIDCVGTGSTHDIYVGGDADCRVQVAHPAGRQSWGKAYNEGFLSLGDNTTFTGKLECYGGRLGIVAGSSSKHVDLQGDVEIFGTTVIGPWATLSSSSARVALYNATVRGDIWRHTAQIHLFDTDVRGNGWDSYLVELGYDAEATAFAVGEVVTGGTSGATGTVWKRTDAGGGAGSLMLTSVTGTFSNDEALTGNIAGAATADGATSAANSPHAEPILLYGASQFSGRYNTGTGNWGTNTIRNSAGILTGPQYYNSVQSFSTTGTIALNWSGGYHTVTRVENTSGGTLSNMEIAGVLATNTRGGGHTPPDGSLWTFYTTSSNPMVIVPGSTIVALPFNFLYLGTGATSGQSRSLTFRWSRALAKFELMPFNPNIASAPSATYAAITATATSGTLPTPNGSITIADATTPTVQELLEYCEELRSQLVKLAADHASLKSKTQTHRIHL